MREEIFNMTQKEVDKLRVINQTIDKVITIRTAAQLLNLCERQIIRLKGGVMNHGPAFLIHKNRGRKPDHAVTDEKQEQIVSLKKSKYQSANFAHFQELLEEHEGIRVSYPTVHRALTQAGIKSPKKHRKTKTHHRRKRKSQAGMLVQIDASPHAWIPGHVPFDLHGGIDDATGNIVGLHFMENECLKGYFHVIEQLLTEHGKPISLYCDRHTIFFSPNSEKLTTQEQLQGVFIPLTQFGRAMDELGIQMIKARSPQAKGRIERLWNTLQSRLPILFELNCITTIEQANAFVPTLIQYFNEKFAVAPEDDVSTFREVDQRLNLSTVLCLKETRTLIDGGAFSYKGRYYQLTSQNQPIKALPKMKVTVLDHEKSGIRCQCNGRVYDTSMLDEPPKKKAVSKVKHQKQQAEWCPPSNHPWKDSFKRPSPWYGSERDSEVLAMLDELFSSTRAWA
jgi:transposase